jgi:hypothetical protein
MQAQNLQSETIITRLENGLTVARPIRDVLVKKEITMARIKAQYVAKTMTAIKYVQVLSRFTKKV